MCEPFSSAVQAEQLARKSSVAMETALARLHKAEEDVAALREAIKAAQVVSPAELQTGLVLSKSCEDKGP